ncbi:MULTISPECIES: TrkH family potassium uptake protein [Cetobacterium]|jgi:trk system potassium uptake protein TrkH|uniref:TrkH family potassium uptake protein n=1 Tax=Candidatus Cetobacterium colombiensis TaxID=3073100 RepID=A0ABU4W9R0_9FUSO|nr:TrkH family potassium uptake protein [Candidatus Cetobacterium colombiensis]MDX8336270.1 TrkH family potassium uptake protein [Candidatus Cetobacterium colombiensis]
MIRKLLGPIDRLSFSRKLILGFFTAIILGSILLYMPFSLQDGEKISFLTAVFTITSAICVTGLSVIDISKVLSFQGQIILLIFIQLGGLGVMTFSSLFFLLIGKKIGYKDRELIKEERNAENSGEIVEFIKKIVIIVLLIEGIGAFFLTLEFLKIFSFSKALYYGIFHSISAFCNAGFALFSNNLENYPGSILMNMTVAYLIILGGIGFSVINSVLVAVRRDVKRFTLTSKVAILVSMFLTFVGMILFFLLEYKNPTTIGNLNWFDKVLASFFQSVTTRTAGFNTVPMGSLKPATIFAFCILMFIGASPGSTGGGIKTTTIGVIVFYVIGVVQGKENINVFNRRISWDILNRALAILIISIIYVSIVIMAVMTIEDMSFEKVVFEVISAFATVGLSMGITADLSAMSKILIIITMFIGRLGPMTFALALGEKKVKQNLRYPKENILVG